MISSSLVLALALAAQDAPPAKPLVVVLPVNVDARAKTPDNAQFAGMLQSELASAARGAEVILLEDAAAQHGVTDPAVLGCNDLPCAGAVGTAVKARYVVASGIVPVGKERVVTVRLQDVEQNRLVAMLTEKAGFDDEALPPVAARAALRLAAAGKIKDLPEPPKPAPKPAEPPPPPPPVVKPVEPPKPVENPTKIIIVPPKQEPPPPDTSTPPAPIMVQPEPPPPAPAPPPVVEEPKGRRVPWTTRAAVIAVGIVLAGWGPIVAPFMALGSAAAFTRAFELRYYLQSRPHFRDEIAAAKSQGAQFEAIGYVAAVAAVALVVFGILIPVTTIIIALLLP